MVNFASGAAFADTGNMTVKTGNGTEMILKKGYFGGEEKSIKDKHGNKIGKKRSGLFGTTQETEFTVFGNGIKKKKGLLGGTKYEGKTMLGDSIQSKRGLFGFGRRNTTVDLSGTTALVKQFIGSKKLAPLGGAGLFGAGTAGAAAMGGNNGVTRGPVTDLSKQDAESLLDNTSMPGQSALPPMDNSASGSGSSTY